MCAIFLLFNIIIRRNESRRGRQQYLEQLYDFGVKVDDRTLRLLLRLATLNFRGEKTSLIRDFRLLTSTRLGYLTNHKQSFVINNIFP